MKKILLIGLIISYSTTLFAVMAYPGEITFKQADGSTFKGHLKGDEWFSWVEGKQGTILTYNKNSKNYELAIIQQVNGVAELTPSGTKFSPSYHTSNAFSLGSQAVDTQVIKKSLSTIWQRKRNEAFTRMKTLHDF